MDDFTLARILLIVAIVPWIGGVAFVTTVLMPAIGRHHPPSERLAAFHSFEAGFAWQARLWFDVRFWWMHAMVAVWAVFAAMLYVAEPLFLHKRMAHSRMPERDFARMERMHRILLSASLIAVVAAMAGAHGLI